ncbi:hypothetical protein ACXYUI_28920, partial [Klebsiella pneumoniae]
MTSAVVTGTQGRLRVSGANIAAIGADGGLGPARAFACDLVAMSGGFTPTVHLFSQSRGKLAFDPACQAHVPAQSTER